MLQIFTELSSTQEYECTVSNSLSPRSSRNEISRKKKKERKKKGRGGTDGRVPREPTTGSLDTLSDPFTRIPIENRALTSLDVGKDAAETEPRQKEDSFEMQDSCTLS